jgi:glutaredoxin
MEEKKENKIKLEKVIIYGNENCPYCKNVKAEFEKEEIEFENRDTTEFEEEWIDVARLTGLPSVPTIKYKNEYFVPGRDFHNPTSLIQILSKYKSSNFDVDVRILEKIVTMNFNFSQSMNNLFMKIQGIEAQVQELHNQLIEKPQENEENVNKSTD